MALLALQVEVEFGHVLEDAMGSFSVCHRVWRGNEEVVHIDDKPPFSDHISE